ncbi:MAG: hypothetical protein EOO17_02800 [Chloroflexi bacterium]|nr:MAG: hypothetical protein EOO17_02800 [Chloroflexota bacterium]
MKIRNPESYGRKQASVKAKREISVERAIGTIEILVNAKAYYGPSRSDIAWSLRQAGSLGKQDRNKKRYDAFTKFSEEVLDVAINRKLVVVEKCASGLKISPNKKSTVPLKTIRKYENVKYPETILDTTKLDPVDLICNLTSGRYTHLRGSSSLRELTNHT